MSIFGSPFFNVMERSLDAATLRQRVYANNIANIDTPNFKRSDVSFEQQLQSYLQGTETSNIVGFQTDPRHIPIQTQGSLQPEVYTDSQTAVNNNGNNVDIDSEMTLVAKNQIQYNALVEQMNQQFSMLKTAINGGGA